jgi:hypothetical protein
VDLPKPDYTILRTAMEAACIKRNLQPVESFLQKCIELFETTLVRHGMMVVGDADAGKSCCINVLADALNSIENNPRFYKACPACLCVCPARADTGGSRSGQDVGLQPQGGEDGPAVRHV